MFNIRGGRDGTCVHRGAAEGFSASFHPGGPGRLAIRPKATSLRVTGHNQTCSNACTRLGLSCISLVEKIALSNLQDCFEFTEPDQDFKMCFACLLSAFFSFFFFLCKRFKP